MHVRVASANMFVHNPDPVGGIAGLVRAVRPMRPPDSIGVQEGSDMLPELRQVPDYQLVADTHGDRFARSNPILVNKRFEIIDTEFIQAAAGTGTSTTPPRNIVIAQYLKQGVKVAHVNTHLHVVPEEDLAARRVAGIPTLNRREKQYVNHVERLVKILGRLRDDGFVVFVTADGNTRPRTGVSDWDFALYVALAKQAKLKVERNGVDIVAYDGKQVKKLERKVISRKVTGSDDHDAIVVATERIR